MGPLIILEGPDCSGKTTLARNTLKDSGYMHFGPPGPEGAYAQYVDRLESLSRRKGESTVVIDRFIYGELVYGPLLRPGDPRMESWQLRMLERVLLSQRAVVVYCQPPQAVVIGLWQESMAQGNELITDQQQMQESIYRFDSLMNLCNLPLIKYDFTQANKTRLDAMIRASTPPENKGPGIGMFKPGITLLVGDQVNASNSTYDWPFVATEGCSPWLARQLLDHKIPESTLYWINAKDADGRLTNPSFLSDLKPGKVVALGKAASVWCAQVPHVREFQEVPHPQFWKRFHSGKPYPLIQAITQ